jgi:hypothetical protein
MSKEPQKETLEVLEEDDEFEEFEEGGFSSTCLFSQFSFVPISICATQKTSKYIFKV